jgi:hypothetical protein
MQTQVHPSFGKVHTRKFLALWLACAISIVMSLVLLRSGNVTTGWTMAGVFALSMLIGLVNLNRAKYRVKCPACKGTTVTSLEKANSRWVSTCARCQIQWDLKLGAGD